jgi:hypothetical protein
MIAAQHVELLVEEPSTEAVLRIPVPRIVESRSFEMYNASRSFQWLRRALVEMVSP